jgi:hypothetical protein
MRRLVKFLSAGILAFASPAAADTVRTNVFADILVQRDLTFDADQSFWLPSCAGQSACTPTDYYPYPLGYGQAVDFSSLDGVHYSATIIDTYNFLVSLEGKLYPYNTVGTATLGLTRTGDTFGDASIQYDKTISSDHFSGSAHLASVYFLSIVPVPEPSTWAMMLFGFGAIGVAMRTRRGSKARIPTQD